MTKKMPLTFKIWIGYTSVQIIVIDRIRKKNRRFTLFTH